MIKVSASQVFVAGGLPTVTYNPRADLRLEDRLRDYLDERHKILSVSGPTKSGKTVLLRSVIKEGVWLAGGEIGTVADFWATVGDKLEVLLEEQIARRDEEATSTGTSGGGHVKPFGIGGGVEHQRGQSSTTGETRTRVRTRPTQAAVKEALERLLPVVVIDDFHYMPQDVQVGVVRGLKDLVFQGLGVVLAAVPHRAYDAVRVEKEMTGRVVQLPIDFWSEGELLGITRAGFAALNLLDPGETLSSRLADESFQSPFLMQDFCLQLVKTNGVREAAGAPITLAAPDWDAFFRGQASAASKSAFDLLAQGPRQRRDRKPRTLADARVTDIYGAVLAAIAHTGPLTQLTYVELRGALRHVLKDDPPSQQEVTRVLQEMSKIAKERIEGEPVVDYDTELETLHISDPFFAYFLRWGIPAIPSSI
ncbi:MAG: GspE family protein [Actinomycetota bacterium]|nr:GspE family protein [Actinomycetota bacterium]